MKIRPRDRFLSSPPCSLQGIKSEATPYPARERNLKMGHKSETQSPHFEVPEP